MCGGGDIVSFDTIIKAISERPSNTIYCEKNEKLCGIITMGNIKRASEERKKFVEINSKFTFVLPNEYMQARKIFREKENINTIPILDENGRVLGDYTRWNDLLYRNLYSKLWENEVEKGENKNDLYIVLVRPKSVFKEKQLTFQVFYKYLLSQKIRIEMIEQDDIANYIDKADKVLFVDKDECSAFDTLYRFVLDKDYTPGKFQTYVEFLENFKKDEKLLEEYLCEIKKGGISVLNIVCKDNDYYRILKKDIDARYTAKGLNKNVYKIPMAFYQDFFDDLYTESYAESIADLVSKVAVDTNSVSRKLKDCSGQYYNVKNGERHTVGQPEMYEKTIYFVGACTIYGLYAEDRNTIESFLQKRLNDAQYKVKVVNCGSVNYWIDVKMALARIMEIPLERGDIIVLLTKVEYIRDIPELNLAEILEKNNVTAKWLLDGAGHCNHKVNRLYAEAIFDKLQQDLSETMVKKERAYVEENVDIVKQVYINQYFRDSNFFAYERVGSIVMNCNPFTYGHRYLIEQALSNVDFLIIFVVEEDKSVFSFPERFSMVVEGVANLDHLMVVPSGPFILSQTTFPEYFIKEADEDIIKNVENDIVLFAEKIAPHLNIKYRFVGEEPEDAVTGEYNKAMKRILPKYGIKLVEIPRKKLDERYISATTVRKCLERNRSAELAKLVPETTQRILFMKNE